ncbi:hypothetical protein D3C76_919830 [compost metagenome]
MGRTEDHRRRRLALAEPGGHLQAIQTRHANVQQDDIRLQAVDQGECLLAIAGGRLQDTVPLEVADQTAEALAG